MQTPYTKINRCVLLLTLFVSALTGQTADLTEGTSPKELYQSAREMARTAPEAAIALAEQAAQEAIAAKDIRTIGKAYYLIGYIYKNLDDIPDAFHYYFGAIRAYQRIGDHMRIQQLYGNLAYIAETKGVHTVAEQLRRDRLRLADEVDYKEQADMHYDLGLSLKQQGDITEAFSAQLQALTILKKNPDLADTAMYANIWLELGIIHRLQAEASNEAVFLDSALVCYDRAKHFNGGNKLHLSKVKNNEGNVLRMLGLFKESKKLLFEALSLNKANDKLDIQTYFNLGRIYFTEGKVDSAVWAFTRSLEINIADLSYLESQDLPQLNIELSKAGELFESVQYLDSLGIRDLEIRGRAMHHVYRMARERYEIIMANNNSMIAQLYDKHTEDMDEEERWATAKSWGMLLLALLGMGTALWYGLKRYLALRHNRRLAEQMGKRWERKYGLGEKE